MPSIGRFSFLPMTSSVTRWFPRIRCQCPQSGNPHFYHCRHHLKGGPNECVNALNRAILISTLPSWNQLFKPLSGLVSAGIFQNILTIILNRGQMWAGGKLYFFSTTVEELYKDIIVVWHIIINWYTVIHNMPFMSSLTAIWKAGRSMPRTVWMVLPPHASEWRKELQSIITHKKLYIFGTYLFIFAAQIVIDIKRIFLKRLHITFLIGFSKPTAI